MRAMETEARLRLSQVENRGPGPGLLSLKQIGTSHFGACKAGVQAFYFLALNAISTRGGGASDPVATTAWFRVVSPI